ncbi:hypothetical protein AX16_004296 [Volvariella volvacea WC 439]|nr:hypothetical protein AX16_004296 [Volvariella volvacea WC 439]
MKKGSDILPHFCASYCLHMSFLIDKNDLSPVMSLPTQEHLPDVPGVNPTFLARCFEKITTEFSPDAGPLSLDSTISTLVSSTSLGFKKDGAGSDPDDDKSAAERARYTDNYPDAFSDTFGTPSEGPLLFKTGKPWPQPPPGSNIQPYRREIRPVAHDHPIADKWDGIVAATMAYLGEQGVKATMVVGLGFANSRPDAKIGSKQEAPFCPLLVIIGVLPGTIEFVQAKTVAEHVKRAILGPAGFGDLDVAVREWESTETAGARLLRLDPAIYGDIAGSRHPFTPTLGVAIAPVKKPHMEGTVGFYLKRSRDSNDIIAITCCHVACPDDAAKGVTLTAGERHHKEIIALGTESFEKSVSGIMTGMANRTLSRSSLQRRIQTLQTRLDNGHNAVRHALGDARNDEERITRAIGSLNDIHDHVTKHLTLRKTGSLAASSTPTPSAPHFEGNKVFIGGSIDEGTYRDLMWPDITDRRGYEFPLDRLLGISGVVPESEIKMPKQRNANREPAMPVVKTGQATGTTFGWVNGLQAGVIHYEHIGGVTVEKFKTMETIVSSYGRGHGAFSDRGDSGAVVLERGGRIVGIVRAGGGLANRTDVTFVTPYYKLQSRIQKALVGSFLYPRVDN